MVTASIVIYKEDFKILNKTINSFLKTPTSKHLFIIDNSPSNNFESLLKNDEITFFFTNKNLGFSKGHNLILNQIKSDYHLILNPDVTFSPQTIPNLISQLKKDEKLAMIAPRVNYPNGHIQYTCRKYPTVIDLIFRRLQIFKNYIQNHEYQNVDLTKPFYPDFIHGCFMLFKTEDFKLINGFDERYFMYLEDADICKKIDKIGKKKLYFPSEKITHIHRKASSKSIKLFLYHLNSAIKYFLKWGI